MRKATVPAVDFNGLEKFSISALGELNTSSGQPLLLPLNEVEEDPENARKEFPAESLKELAESIKTAGRVIEPISVRPVDANGKYIINSGARRFRASKLAGMTEIAAFVDDQADEFSRFVVNEQRENLSPMDIANFIAKHGGKLTHEQLAVKIGKSRQYVSQHATLTTLPPSLRSLYDNNICRSPTALSDLARLHKKNADIVDIAVADIQEVTAALLFRIRELIAAWNKPPKAADAGEDQAEPSDETTAAKDTKKKESKGIPIQITVKHKGKTYRLLGDFIVPRKPRGDGTIYVVKGRDDPVSVAVGELELDAVLFK